MRRWAVMVYVLMALTVSGAWECSASEVKLRKWFVSVDIIEGYNNKYDVFGKDDALPGVVSEKGSGIGITIGHRFGQRFLLGVQLANAEHNIANSKDMYFDTELLVTGTVLFRHKSTFQPFIVGGIGAGGALLIKDQNKGYLISAGTVAIVGGGVQVRMSSRFSLKMDSVATFNNFYEAYDNSDVKKWDEESWQVRTSNYGWRGSLGIAVWF